MLGRAFRDVARRLAFVREAFLRELFPNSDRRLELAARRLAFGRARNRRDLCVAVAVVRRQSGC